MNDTPRDITVENVESVTTGSGHPAPVNDTLTVRLVVILLGLFAVGVLIAETVLQGMDKTLPDQILTLAGVAIGALGAMLASTASRKN